MSNRRNPRRPESFRRYEGNNLHRLVEELPFLLSLDVFERRRHYPMHIRPLLTMLVRRRYR